MLPSNIDDSFTISVGINVEGDMDGVLDRLTSMTFGAQVPISHCSPTTETLANKKQI